MDIKEGATVVTTGGDEVGSIDRVVIDPRTKQITHLVVRKGLLFTEDKVLPMEYVNRSDGDTLVISQDAGDLEKLPDYLEREYIPLDGHDIEDLETHRAVYAPTVYWYPAYGPTWTASSPAPYTPVIQVPSTVERNIPEDTVPLKEGSNIFSADGKHIGDLERVLTSPETDRATHFVMTHGVLFKERRVVPMLWVRKIEEDKITLDVDSRFVERLPDYEEPG